VGGSHCSNVFGRDFPHRGKLLAVTGQWLCDFFKALAGLEGVRTGLAFAIAPDMVPEGPNSVCHACGSSSTFWAIQLIAPASFGWLDWAPKQAYFIGSVICSDPSVCAVIKL